MRCLLHDAGLGGAVAALHVGGTALQGGQGDLHILVDLLHRGGAHGHHVAGTQGGEGEGDAHKGRAAAGGHGLDGHHGLLGAPDDLVHVFDLHLHQKAHAVVELDVGFHVVLVQVGVDDQLGHVGGQAGQHAPLADHVGVVGQAVQDLLVLVDQLLGGLVVDEAKVAAAGLGLVEGGLGLFAALGAVVHTGGGGVDADDALARVVLGLLDGVKGVGHIAQGAHDGVDAVLQIGLEDGGHGVQVAVALDDLLVRRGAGVGIAEDPVGADQQAGQGNAAHHGSGKGLRHG